MLKLLSLSLFALTCVEGFYEGNINYNSPSRRHDHFGIDLPKVRKRLVETNKLSARAAGPAVNFTHSVASGDPLCDSVILWTRLAPISNTTVLTAPLCLTYVVSTKSDCSDTITSGTVYTSSDVDYTVKAEATDLKAFTTYYYRFKSCDGSATSPIGRTKTSPGQNDKVAAGIKFAVYSCSNYSKPLECVRLICSSGILSGIWRTGPSRFSGLCSPRWRLHLRIWGMWMYVCF